MRLILCCLKVFIHKFWRKIFYPQLRLKYLKNKKNIDIFAIKEVHSSAIFRFPVCYSHEKNFPAQRGQTQTTPWFSGAYENPRGPSGSQCSAR
tara:strand:+ start:479 stop:757 length:279 start_codon:yes stop_codon:yes gene_type:complete